jgi:N-dimethylarginine dimethylaminohydrolase
MVDTLRRVVVRRPEEAFGSADPVLWHYVSTPDLTIARREHDALVAVLSGAGAEVLYQDEPSEYLADAIFVHDPAIVTDAGAIILQMGKALRRGEASALARCLSRAGIPILYTLHGDATAEGGDLLWLDHDTLAVGQGFRTNEAGFTQLREALSSLHVEVVPVPLPYFGGAEACLHLMSLISVVDHDLAVVYSRLLPVPFWKLLRERGFKLIEVPDDEFPTMGPNVLALAPRNCVTLEGNPITRKRLEKAGCQVTAIAGYEMSFKAEGGPTCLTRPVWRA